MPGRHEASILETEYLIKCSLIKAEVNLRGGAKDGVLGLFHCAIESYIV
jgi:hypothetical protein